MQTLITMRFVGTQYHGFQVQKNALSVCEVLQNAMEKLYGTRPLVKGCSRTDTGVHALGYCVSYQQPKPIDEHKLPLALNQYLPRDIRVMSAVCVNDDFHARYSSVTKEYKYIISNSAIDDPFKEGLVWRFPAKLDIIAMQNAAQKCEGTHDFRAFMSSGSKIEDTVRNVESFTVQIDGENIVFHIKANGYLYNMVRILVGTLVEVGIHHISPLDIPEIIASKDRAKAGDTAPAKGLYLYKVNYGELI